MMEKFTEALHTFIAFLNDGGMIMWVLFVLNLFLWYGLGYRYLLFKRGTEGNVRRLIEKHYKRGMDKILKPGLLDKAIVAALHAAQEAKKIGANCRAFTADALFPYREVVKAYAVLVKTIVILAPLVGLLGTVMGMIETFDALQSSAMFGQGTSISGGISKALFTTELGLIVAVPGLIFGRVLDKREQQYQTEFEQIEDVICTTEEQ